jgi:hypothetical protein
MTNILPDWLNALKNPLPGELASDHIVRAVMAFQGVSLINKRDMLNALFLINEPDAATAAQTAAIQTNCGTFARQILNLCGAPDSYLTRPYQSGMAISFLVQAGYDCGAIIDCTKNPENWKLLRKGYLVRYCSPGSSNDHMEFVVSDYVDGSPIFDHIGGGRPNNSVGPLERGDIRTSMGRPIAMIFDPNKWGISTLQSPISPPILAPIIPSPTIQDNPQPTPNNSIMPPQPNNSTNILSVIVKQDQGVILTVFNFIINAIKLLLHIK